MSMTALAKLLPCPFCGSDVESYQQTSKVPDNWAVRCDVCGAQCGPSASTAAARYNWNTRALSARASAGEGGESEPPKYHCQNGSGRVCLAASLRFGNVVCPHDECDIDTGVFEMPTPAPQPAQAGASGGMTFAFMAEVCDAAVQAMQANGLIKRTIRLQEVRDQLRQFAAAPQPQQSEWLECSGDPMACPENEGFGCCKSEARQCLCEWPTDDRPDCPAHPVVYVKRNGSHGEYPSPSAAPQPQEAPAQERGRVMQQANFRAACYALVGIVDGVEGRGRRWAANGERLKDTPEWAVFYNAVAAMRNGALSTTPPARGDGEGDSIDEIVDYLDAVIRGEYGSMALHNSIKRTRDRLSALTTHPTPEAEHLAENKSEAAERECKCGVFSANDPHTDWCPAKSDQPSWYEYWTGKGRSDIANDYGAFQLAEKWAAALALPAQGEGKA